MIRFDCVTRTFTTPARGMVLALDRLSIECAPGRITCVVGPSGCGKSTLLRLAAGLLNPESGQVLVNGRIVHDPPQGLAMVSQEGDLLPWRRILPNIALGLELRRIARRQRHELAAEAMQRVGLSDAVGQSYPHELSGGMRRRVALARALCVRPSVLLMDEPFAAVDEPSRHELQQDMLDLCAANEMTVLFVTHSIEEAVFLADTVAVMTAGRVVATVRPGLPATHDRLSGPFIEALLRVRRELAGVGREREESVTRRCPPLPPVDSPGGQKGGG